MRTMSFFAIIAITILIIYIILVLLRKTSKPDNTGYYTTSIKVLHSFMIIIGSLFAFTPFSNSYYLGHEQKQNTKYHLPQIDSTMQLIIHDRFIIGYRTFSKESIRHDRKTIHRDLYGYDRVEDEFVNEKLNVKMKVKFEYPNIVRHSKRTNTISWRYDDNELDDNEITTHELDSILTAWGLHDQTYHQFLN